MYDQSLIDGSAGTAGLRIYGRLLPALNIPMEDLEFAVETIRAAAKELGENV